jgi:gamma-glutamyl-gamma-aminobutyrate hydrolase PuuD
MRILSAMYASYYPFDAWAGATSFAWTTDPADMSKEDVLVVWGGSDISPSLYRKPVSRKTHAGPSPSHRDAAEWALMQRAAELGVPIVGVCRGAQMLCALAGGYLIQHVDNHGGTHYVTRPNGEEYKVNSIHHQMMYPFDVKHEMLASITPGLSRVHYDVDTDVPMSVEPEFVYFPEIKGFAVQWHPEGLPIPGDGYRDHRANEHLFEEMTARIAQ